MLNGATVIVGIGRTYAHRLDFLYASYLVDNHLECSDSRLGISFGSGIALGLDGCCSLDVTSAIYNSKYRICAA